MSKKTSLLALIFLFFSFTLAFGEEKYIPVTEAALELNTDLSWELVSQEIIFSDKDLSASCKIGEPLILYNSLKAGFAEPPIIKKGVIYISIDMFNKLQYFFSNSNEVCPYRVGALLIDPGHGGRDAGCVYSYIENEKTIVVYEKDVVLRASLDLYNKLKQKYPDKKILLTRNSDTYPELEDRVNIANSVKLKKNEAILYISVHANAMFNNRASGFEVWYLSPEYRRTVIDKTQVPKEIFSVVNSMMEEEFTTESVLLAQSILDGLDAEIGKQSRNRGIKEKEFFVIRNVKMPSVLIELGFLSNEHEIRLLNSPEYLKKCSLGIYNGLVNFISDFENSGGFVSK